MANYKIKHIRKMYFVIYILFLIISVNCNSSKKAIVLNSNAIPDSISICKINNIIIYGNVFIIEAENSSYKFKILTKNSIDIDHIDLYPKKHRDILKIGKIYKLKLTRLFPRDDNFVYGNITHLLFNGCSIPIKAGEIFFTSDELKGIEIR